VPPPPLPLHLEISRDLRTGAPPPLLCYPGRARAWATRAVPTALGAAGRAGLLDTGGPHFLWVGAGGGGGGAPPLFFGAGVGSATWRCSRLQVNAKGTYVLADVAIPRATAPGSYPLTLRTAAGSTTVPFSVSAPLAARGRFQGFGTSDVVYLLMPDRFANGDPGNDTPAIAPGEPTARSDRHGGGEPTPVDEPPPAGLAPSAMEALRPGSIKAGVAEAARRALASIDT